MHPNAAIATIRQSDAIAAIVAARLQAALATLALLLPLPIGYLASR
ncbi:MAG: hypothetical protein V4634_04690 [Pseudomonadota bacterium]